MLDRLIDKLVSLRLPIVLSSLLCTLICGWGLSYLVTDTDYRAFFNKDYPQLVSFNKLNDTFSKTDSVFFVIQPKTGTVFTPDTLKLLKEMTEKAWQLPLSLRVDSITNFQHSEADADSLMVDEMVPSVDDLTSAQLKAIEQAVLAEPQLLAKLISEDGRVSGVNVTINLPDQAGEALHRIGAAARALRDDFAARYPDVSFHLSGFVEYSYACEMIMRHEVMTLVPLMLLVVLVLLSAVLKSFYGTLATLVVILCSIVTGMGIMGWLGWPISTANAGAPTIILTMAVADCVHILVTYFFNLRAGEPKFQAMRNSLKINFQPVFITSLTTAIGFLSMNYSDLPPFHVLGNVVAIGVVAAFVFALTLLPALMLLLPANVKPPSVLEASEPENHAIAPFADFVVKNSRAIFWGSALITVLLIACIPLNQINDNFMRFISKGQPTRDATDFINDNLSSFYSIEYAIESPYEGGIYSPQYLQQLDQFVTWLKAQPEVSQVMTITDVFKRLNQNMHGDDAQWYQLPQQRELAAQYLLLYEFSLPFGLDLNNQISFDKQSSRLIVNLHEQNTSSMLKLEKKYGDYLRQNFPELHYFDGSTTLLFAHAGVNNALSMLEGSVLALVLISAILILALRALRIGLLSMIPNLIPAGLAFGIWGLVAGDIGISIAIAIGMTLGIVVDNTVHFLSKYVRVRREKNFTAEQAVRYSFSNVGVALLVTNVILIAGFLVLSQSSLVLNSQMGLFTALTFFMALIVDFLFLPALLLKVDSKRRYLN